MSRTFASLVALAVIVGAVTLACGSGSADASGGDFGCCPDQITGCTLYRYGKKMSADDTCVVGHDGTVPDPSQPGWTRGKDANGCPFWAPPANATSIVCGRATVPDVDADVDAALSDADASDAADAADDASDAATE